MGSPLVVTLRSEPKAVWKWAHLITPLALAIGVPLFAIENAQALSVQTIIVFEILAIVPLALLFGYGLSFYWRWRLLPNWYEIDGDSLRVCRSGAVLREIHRDELIDFWIRDHVDWRVFLTQTPPPSWPRGVVVLKQGVDGEQKVVLPPLAIWGKTGAQSAELAVRTSLGLPLE